MNYEGREGSILPTQMIKRQNLPKSKSYSLPFRSFVFLVLIMCTSIVVTMWLAFPSVINCSNAPQSDTSLPRWIEQRSERQAGMQGSYGQYTKVNVVPRNLSLSRDSPIIFVGGVPRSGTTLFRAMLDAHPDVRCGEETRVVPRLLFMRQRWLSDVREKERLFNAGVTDSVINDALASFILEIIAKHGEPAKRLCDKDPLALKMMDYLSILFPKAKFVMLVRDGRAVANSIVQQKIRIQGVDSNSFEGALKFWNNAGQVMYSHCRQLKTRCLMVRYEDLVTFPSLQMKRALQFLDMSWNSAVLHHEKAIGQPGGVSLSNLEPSSKQVQEPIHTKSLRKWERNIPADMKESKLHSVAPLLKELGYD